MYQVCVCDETERWRDWRGKPSLWVDELDPEAMVVVAVVLPVATR